MGNWHFEWFAEFSPAYRNDALLSMLAVLYVAKPVQAALIFPATLLLHAAFVLVTATQLLPVKMQQL